MPDENRDRTRPAAETPAADEETPGASRFLALRRFWLGRRLPLVATIVVLVALSVALVLTNLRISRRPDLGSSAVSAIARAESKAAVSQLQSAPAVATAVYSAARAGLVLIEARHAGGGSDLGSGFIVNSNGDILTALHVVQGEPTSRSPSPTARHPAATIKSSDPGHDIAVLTASKLPAVIVPEVLGGAPRSATRRSPSAIRSASSARCRPG